MSYRIHYLRQDWSEHYESHDVPEALVRHPTGEVTVDLGLWVSLAHWMEGLLPGVYLVTPPSTVRNPNWEVGRRGPWHVIHDPNETFVLVHDPPSTPVRIPSTDLARRVVGDLL